MTLLKPILAKLDELGYKVCEYNDTDIFNTNDELCEYSTSYLQFGPLKDTKEKEVAKFIFKNEYFENKDIDTLLVSDDPHAAIKQFVGILRLFNEGNTTACRIYIDGLRMTWFFESEISIDEDKKWYKVYINCMNGDTDSKLPFNPYLYDEEYKKILMHIYDAVCELKENPRFTKMY